MELKPLLSMIPRAVVNSTCRVQAKGGQAVIEIVNGDIQTQFLLPAPITAEFAGTVSHESFLSPGYDSIVVTDTGFQLGDRKSPLKHNIGVAEGDSFPVLPMPKPGVWLRNNSKAFRTLLSQVESNRSNDEARPNLTHVLAQVESNRVTLVSTDGHRMARIFLPEENAVVQKSGRAKQENYMIPGLVFSIFAKLDKAEYRFDASAQKYGTKASVVWGGDSLLDTESYEIRISGADSLVFPNFNQVIPEFKQVTVSGSAKVLLDAVKVIGKRADSRTKAVVMTVEDQKLTLSARRNVGTKSAPVYDEVSMEVAGLVIPEGSMKRAQFNYTYLVDALSGYDKVRVFIADALSPAGFLGETDDQLLIVMPMRL